MRSDSERTASEVHVVVIGIWSSSLGGASATAAVSVSCVGSRLPGVVVYASAVDLSRLAPARCSRSAANCSTVSES